MKKVAQNLLRKFVEVDNIQRVPSGYSTVRRGIVGPFIDGLPINSMVIVPFIDGLPIKNGPFIVCFPIKNGGSFQFAMLNSQMVVRFLRKHGSTYP